MTRPRAADDFPVIRARLEELRRERGETTPAADDDRTPGGPRPYAVGVSEVPGRSPGLSPTMRRVIQRVRTA